MIWERPPEQIIVEAEPWADEFCRRLSPPGFIRSTELGLSFYRPPDRLVVVVSGRTESDGRRWVHVSASHPNRLPTWEKMGEVKALFIGEDRRAIQLFVPEDEHVNLHPYCLHLWHCVDGDGLPDFRPDGRQV